MITIKILGSGCANCKKLEAMARQAAGVLGIEATFVKVTDVGEILDYDVYATPALVLDERVVVAGRVPSQAELSRWLQDVPKA